MLDSSSEIVYLQMIMYWPTRDMNKLMWSVGAKKGLTMAANGCHHSVAIGDCF